MIEDPTGLEEMTTAYYKNLYTSEGVHNMEEVLRHVPTKVTPDMNNLLNAPYSQEEVKCALFQMFPINAPGPDGFSGAFLKACWPIIKHDFYALCSQFFEGTLDITSINDGFITLIPKVNSPESVNDYRPISLTNTCLKILTKILANGLQKVILSCIHKNQYDFLKSRSIQD